MKNLLCKIFGHKYVFDSDSLLPLEMYCKRCGHDHTIPYIKEHIKEQLNSSKPNNLKEIKEDIDSGRLGGKWCSDGTNIGLVIAAVATIEDYYYVILTSDYKIKYWSCVGKIWPIEYGDEYNFEKMFPETLKDLIKKQLEQNKNVEVLFTDIKI